MSSERVRDQASKQEPAILACVTVGFFVAPSTVGFGMARMFQIAGETTHPEITIARSLGEVFDAVGIEPPQFEPLE
jgi:hypothetical protein